MLGLYLDESGDHYLRKPDPQYPIFVLGGIIADQAYLQRSAAPALSRLKQRFFGNPDLPLHTSDLLRNRKGFEALIDRDTRQRFYAELNELIEGLDFIALACALHKDEAHPPTTPDPYEYCLQRLIGKFMAHLERRECPGVVIAERRSASLDAHLASRWQAIAAMHKVDHPRRRPLPCLQLRTKSDRLAGLELADLMVSPVGRMLIGKPTRADWTIVHKKLGPVNPNTGRPENLDVLPIKNWPPLRSDQRRDHLDRT